MISLDYIVWFWPVTIKYRILISGLASMQHGIFARDQRILPHRTYQ
jgi:hypothetical protein